MSVATETNMNDWDDIMKMDDVTVVDFEVMANKSDRAFSPAAALTPPVSCSSSLSSCFRSLAFI